MSSSQTTFRHQAGSGFQPYIGLRPFTEQEKDRFFGRSNEASILLDKIRANRLTLLLAASGVGKSSLLQAGIMPELRTDSNIELIYYNVWSASPQAFKQAVSEHYGEPYKDVSLKSILRACTLFSSGQLVLLLDQFEEFFNYQRFRSEFRPFIKELSAAILDHSLPVSFVFSMREDFALELNSFKDSLSGVFDNYFRLEKLTCEQAREAIEKPLEGTGYCFAPQTENQEALLDQVLHDLAKREQERQFGVQELLKLNELPLLVEPPHLQIVCQELWQRHRDDKAKQITHAAYDKAGRTAGILNSYFLGKIKLFSRKEQSLASAAFDHLIGQRNTKISHSLARLAELTGSDEKDLQSVLERLQEDAILRRQKRGEEFWYELYHDIFSESIDHWNREFKARQRVKRFACGTVAALLAGCVLFAGNNWRVNYYGRYLQCSQQESSSNRIEVYRGRLNGLDLFRQQRFLYETPFLHQEMEAGRQFYQIAIEDNVRIRQELISRLQVSDCFSNSMQNGFYETGYRLAEKVLSADYLYLITLQQIERFSLVRTRKNAQQLILFLDESNDTEVLQTIIRTLAALRINTAIPHLRKFIKEKNPDIQATALKALAVLYDNEIASHVIMLLKQVDKNDSRMYAINQVVRTFCPKEAIHEIRKLIQEQAPETRAAAVEVLAALHADETSSDAIALLEDKDAYVREAAAHFLELLQCGSAVPEIRKLMQDEEPYAQVAAIKALGTLHDKEVLPEVRKLSEDRNAEVRAAAILFLALLHDKQKLPAIRELIQDRDSSVQRAALNYIATLHVNESIPEIKKLLDHNNFFVQENAVKALTALHDSESLPDIRKLVFQHWILADEVVGSLATFRDIEAIPAIRMHSHFWFYAWLQVKAIKALATLHDSSSIPEIRKFILYGVIPSVQAAAVQALGTLHDKEAVAEIRRFLDNGDPYVQIAAVKSLGILHDNAAVPAIRSLSIKGDWKVQEAAIRTLGRLHDDQSIFKINERLADKYPDIQLAAAQALARLNHSSPQLISWQWEQLEALSEKTASEYTDERKEAAQKLSSIFTEQSVTLLDKLIDDSEWSVIIPALESLGIIGEYAPGLVRQQVPKLLALTGHTNLELQDTAVSALGRFISFRGEAKDADFQEMDQKIRSTLQSFILNQDPKNSFRRTVAVEALGATGRPECARDFEQVLNKLQKSDSLYYRCLYWMKRLETDNSSGEALQVRLSKELNQLTDEKSAWRKQRDKNDELRSSEEVVDESKSHENERWPMEQIEHLLGHTLARISPTEQGVKLLNHPLYQVRQGAIRALAAKTDAPLIGKIINAHQNFDLDDLPSPFPYAAFQAIDLALWNLEYTGKKEDVTKLKDILKNLKPCQVPGQEGAIRERLEWTIERLAENLAKNAELAGAK